VSDGAGNAVGRPRTLIRGARLLDPTDGFDAIGDLLIEGLRIAAYGGTITAGDALAIEADGLCLAPGLVDMRVQLREPGAEHMESIESGGRARGSRRGHDDGRLAQHRAAGR
jgi:dihydroorotase